MTAEQQDASVDDGQDLDWYPEVMAEWVGMPEYIHRDLKPWKRLQVQFSCQADMDAFAELIGAPVTEKTPSVWYPPMEDVVVRNKMRYINEESLDAGR